MTIKIKTFLQPFLKKDLPDMRAGDTVRIYQKIPARIATRSVAGGKEKGKEKPHVFEGIIIGKSHGKEIGAAITVRRVISDIGVEKIFPIHSPTIEKIEIVKRGKVRRAKLYYLREAKGKKARLKKRELGEAIVWEEPKIEVSEEKPSEDSETKKIQGKEGAPEKVKEQKTTETASESKPEPEKESKNEP